MYCTVLYCTVLYCNVLYCTVLYCTVLYCTVLYCTILYCIVVYKMYCTVYCAQDFLQAVTSFTHVPPPPPRSTQCTPPFFLPSFLSSFLLFSISSFSPPLI